MHADNLIIDEGGDWQAIEDVLELLPEADGIAALAIIVEAVDAINLRTLVVTPQEEDVLLKFDLVCEKQDYGFE